MAHERAGCWCRSRHELYTNWLLWDVLFELNSLFTESSKQLQDACQQITAAVLAIGVECITRHHGPHGRHTIAMIMKFFNTFMRTAVNLGGVKLCCRVLNHYRKLVEAMIEQEGRFRKQGDKSQGGSFKDEVVTAVKYLTYYAHIAYVKQVYFIAEVVAYDISMLCETAHHHNFGEQEEIVRLLLEVDEVPDDKAQLETLRGGPSKQYRLALCGAHS